MHSMSVLILSSRSATLGLAHESLHDQYLAKDRNSCAGDYAMNLLAGPGTISHAPGQCHSAWGADLKRHRNREKVGGK